MCGSLTRVDANWEKYPQYSIEEKRLSSKPSCFSRVWHGMRVSLQILYETPAEAAAIAVGAVVMRFVFPSLSTPFIGICASLVVTRFAIKILDHCAPRVTVGIKKEACKLNRLYPKLHLISFLFTLAISLLSPPLGLIFGGVIGTYSAIILDVENNKFLRQEKRKAS